MWLIEKEHIFKQKRVFSSAVFAIWRENFGVAILAIKINIGSGWRRESSN